MTNYMIIKQRVTDLAQFQAAFDELKPVREKHGLKDLGQFRAAEESDIVIIMLEVADVAKAKEYWHSTLLAQGRVNAGALGSLPVGTSVQADSTNEVWLTNGLVRETIAGRSRVDM
jgi:hypothetical protein